MWSSFVDPNVESDIYADVPWALSPMVASMNYMSISKSDSSKQSGKPMVDESHPGLEGESSTSSAGIILLIYRCSQ
jgi:hypothetical protein